MPVLTHTLSERWHEGWLASPAVADLDADGTREIIVARAGRLQVWHLGAADGTLAWSADVPSRIWASPVVADIVPGQPGLEVAVSSGDSVYVWLADGTAAPGFPASWRGELRSLATGDINGDGALELVAVTTMPLEGSGQRDIVMAFAGDGSMMPGFPANTGGAAGCDDACYVTGGYDQNIGLGNIDGDVELEIIASQDNAYNSVHDGDGRAFDANPIFDGRSKYSGIRFMVDYALAQQGYADDESVDEQGHFTNTAPVVADVDGDGVGEVVLLGSVQNAAQDDRERGVALWVTKPDGTRPSAWTTPPKFPGYVSGLWDYGNNVVGITNQPSAVDLDPSRPGPEFVFAGFDGAIHAVDAQAQTLWSHTYTSSDTEGTAGVAVADLSGDGSPEVVFATYSDDGGAELIILDAAGNRLHALPLPDRGSMAVPTIADANGDGVLDIVLDMKGAGDRTPQALIYSVAGASDNCLAWPTGRGNYRRDGYLPP